MRHSFNVTIWQVCITTVTTEMQQFIISRSNNTLDYSSQCTAIHTSTIVVNSHQWGMLIILSLHYIYIFCLWHCGPTPAIASSFLRFIDHTRHIRVGRTSLDEWLAHRTDLYLTTHITWHRQTSMHLWWDSNPQSKQVSSCRPTP